MHFPAPRSRFGTQMHSLHRSMEPSWMQPFLPQRSVGARWRWFLIIGTFIAGALFPVGKNSDAANENQTESATEQSETSRPTIQKPGQDAVKPAVTNAENAVSPQSGQPDNSQSTKQSTPVSQSTPIAAAAQSTGESSEKSAATVANSAADSSASPSASTPAPLPARKVTLSLVVDGQSRRIDVPVGQNVFQALSSAGIELQSRDRVWPDAKMQVKEGLAVRVETVREKLEKRTSSLAGGMRVQLSSQIYPGTEQVVQWPKAGVMEITERVVYVGGKRVRKALVAQRVVTPAQDKIIALGVDGRFMPSAVPYHNRYARAYQAERQLSARGGSPRDRMTIQTAAGPTQLRAVRSFIVKTSGYAAGPAGGSLGNYTATGMRCVRGAVATDPRIIPLGTKLYIEGYGYAFACDTGGAIKGKRIDLAFNTVRECFQHGRRTARVWILAE